MEHIFIIVITALVIISPKLAYNVVAEDRFYEELFIKPLPSSKLYAYFQFTTLWDRNKPFEHSSLLPNSLGEIISQFNVQEVHLSLTEGQWRHEQWGYPVVDAAAGAELYSWFPADTENVDSQWQKLSHALSGLFCTSLNFINAAKTVEPQMVLAPLSPSLDIKNSSTHLRFASLPREIVCTENLTPWKKLLPCEAKEGLAMLLNSQMIHNTNYHSLGVHFRTVCADADCTDLNYELKQTMSLVFDLDIVGSRDWSFRKLFGQGLLGPCPLADISKIYVDISTNSTNPFILSHSFDVVKSIRGGSETVYALFDAKKVKILNIASKHTQPTAIIPIQPPPLHFSRYVIGYGQEYGGIVTEIINNHWSTVHVVFMENTPWWLPLHLSSLRVNGMANNDAVISRHFSPGRSRERPYHLELLLKIPPRSKTTISINFDLVFLKWQEYPPDANHGFYIGSALIAALLPTAKNFTGLPVTGSTIYSSFNASQPWYSTVLRTGVVAVSLPTPDFSMPYNVICLACTVVALAFGPLHNICTKQLSLQPTKGKKPIWKRFLYFFVKEKSE